MSCSYTCPQCLANTCLRVLSIYIYLGVAHSRLRVLFIPVPSVLLSHTCLRVVFILSFPVSCSLPSSCLVHTCSQCLARSVIPVFVPCSYTYPQCLANTCLRVLFIYLSPVSCSLSSSCLVHNTYSQCFAHSSLRVLFIYLFQCLASTCLRVLVVRVSRSNFKSF